MLKSFKSLLVSFRRQKASCLHSTFVSISEILFVGWSVYQTNENMNKLLLAVAMSVFALIASAQDPSIRKKHFNIDDGIALSGYDAVAYLNEKRAVKGKREFLAVHEGINYYFSSAANRDEFRKNPARYEPAYGGWCAYAMGATGEKVSVDPKTFKIVNGRLNLFYNRLFNNTLEDWNKDESNLKKKADLNWAKVLR